MKFSLLVLAVLSFAAAAQAQTDPGIQAAQQAAQQAQQASERAIADMQHAMDQATLASQQAMANLNNANQAANTPAIPATIPPKISVKPGIYTQPITVKLTNRSRGAIMYYTTDGWTPTTASPRYLGPITIDSTTTLKVIAVSPYGVRSLVTSAAYAFPGSPAKNQPAVPVPEGTIPVSLLFAKDVNSKTAEIGDKIPMTLSDNLVLNGNVVARKGASASVTIIQVDKTGAAGAPGNLEFQIDPLPTAIGQLKLLGSATLEGKPVPPNAAVLIPVVGLFTLFRHGHDAVIHSGTPFTAYLDTSSLVASNAP